MTDRLRKKLLYLAALSNDSNFKEFISAPLDEFSDRALMTLRNTSATEREIYTAQGALQVLDFISDLLSRPLEDLKRLERKGQPNGNRQPIN